MIPVDMIVKHAPESGSWGDCTRACIASIFELQPDQVPHFCEKGEEPRDADGMLPWEKRFRAWLADRGYAVLWLKFESQEQIDAWDERTFMFHHIRGGVTHRGTNHDTVWFGHRMVHDPHPTDKRGIVGFPQIVGIIAKA